jgi:hypothetical protein
LNAAIRVMELRAERPKFKGAFESLLNQGSGQGRREFPADQTLGTKIEFSRQIKPAILLGRQVG